MKPANHAGFLLHAVRVRSIAYSLTCEYNSGDEMTGHGFRGMASTMLHEQGRNIDVIERQLAHAKRNKVKAAYNHAEYLLEYRKMMQAWADYLDALRTGANVTPLRRMA